MSNNAYFMWFLCKSRRTKLFAYELFHFGAYPDNFKTRSFGVISFYKQQSKNIEATIVAAAATKQLDNLKLGQKQREEYSKTYHAETQ